MISKEMNNELRKQRERNYPTKFYKIKKERNQEHQICSSAKEIEKEDRNVF